MPSDYAVLLKAHYWDDDLAASAAELRERAPSADHFLFLDETNGAIGPISPHLFPDRRILRCRIDDAARLGLPKRPHDRVFWYNGDYPLYLGAALLAGYDHVLMVEHDVAIRLDIDAMVQAARAAKLDFVAEPIPGPPEDWYWMPTLNGVYPLAAQRPCLICVCLIARRAWQHLFAMRILHAAQYVDGSFAARRQPMPPGRIPSSAVESWPFSEGFVATELAAAGFRMAPLSDFGSTADYDWYPPYLAADVPGLTGFIHPVLGESRYIASCLNGLGEADQWFDPQSHLRQRLDRCAFPSVQAALRRAFATAGRTDLFERLDAGSAR